MNMLGAPKYTVNIGPTKAPDVWTLKDGKPIEGSALTTRK
jgi:hypothetical protein